MIAVLSKLSFRNVRMNNALNVSFSTCAVCMTTSLYGWQGFRPSFDVEFWLKNRSVLLQNMERRGVVVDLERIFELHDKIGALESRLGIKYQALISRKLDEGDDAGGQGERFLQIDSNSVTVFTADSYERSKLKKDLRELESEFYDLAARVPNLTSDETPTGGASQAVTLETVGERLCESAVDHRKYLTNSRLLRSENLGHISGLKSCFMLEGLALLENALAQYAMSVLVRRGFTFMAVPNLVKSFIVEGCGFVVDPKRKHQVFTVADGKHDDLCLSGTGEIPLAGFFFNTEISEKRLPLRVATYSQCFRSEVPSRHESGGLYRLPQFGKVEMFGVTSREGSTLLFDEFVSIQKEIYSGLGLRYLVKEMPTLELGLPAYRKIDMEAWMPGRQHFGEISSCSNCTDFQTRRLRIRYSNDLTTPRARRRTSFCHTVNGTACAIPRTIIAIVEQFQEGRHGVPVPEVLKPFMFGMERLKFSTVLKGVEFHKGTTKRV